MRCPRPRHRSSEVRTRTQVSGFEFVTFPAILGCFLRHCQHPGGDHMASGPWDLNAVPRLSVDQSPLGFLSSLSCDMGHIRSLVLLMLLW